MKHKSPILTSKLSRRRVLAYGAATALATPFISRAWAAPVEINMLAWYGHGEPDVVAVQKIKLLKKMSLKILI